MSTDAFLAPIQHLTTAEAERYWYGLGLPMLAPADVVDDALADDLENSRDEWKAKAELYAEALTRIADALKDDPLATSLAAWIANPGDDADDFHAIADQLDITPCS